MSAEYKAENIKVLEGLEGVRMRPAMYIGGTDKHGLHHLVYEVVDNSVDEALAGHCDFINIILHKDGSCTVEDNGRGIPVDIHSTYKVPAAQVALTKLHAGGKFDKGSYAISGGLHGVGLSCVNALSKTLYLKIKKDGKVYEQEYSRGIPTGKLKVIGSCGKNESGTLIRFWPDEQIFSELDFDAKVLQNRFREVAFLNAGLRIKLLDENNEKKEEFFAAGGIIEFVKWANRKKEALHPKPIYFKNETEGLEVEISIQYSNTYQENIFGFVNTINTVEGGTHVSGLKTAITRVLNDYAKKKGSLKNGESFMGEDAREGLTAIVSIKIADPQFEGQTKTKLGNSNVRGHVDSLVTASLAEYLEENPSVAKKIIDKALSSAKARLAAKKAKDLVRRKNEFSLGGLPGKLADCSSKKSEESELYIVEGDSAGGCFSGDTKIALLDGRNLSFKELIKEDKRGKENFCYTIKDDGTIGVEKIKSPRITKRNAQVIKVILDNGEEIVCTPDHKFMLRNGDYKEAQNLSIKDSIMPLNRKKSKIGGKVTIEGYEMVFNTDGKWIFTHLLSDKYNLNNNVYLESLGSHRHHIDFNKLNNNPTNILRTSKEEHLIIHTKNLKKTLYREDVKEKARIAHQDNSYRKKMSDWAKQPKINKMLSKRAKEQWKDDTYKNFMIRKFKEFCEDNPEYVELNRKILYNAQKEYWSDPKNRKKASDKVKKFFKENPDAKAYLSHLAREQWKNQDLIEWRIQKTKEQWTPEFRKKRRVALDKTYYDKTIKLMKEVLEEKDSLDSFDRLRISKKDKSVLSKDSFCKRYFNNDEERMFLAVKNYNHKIRKIIWLNKKIDVYDIEVPNTHNFALSSGVFVHNSAKMARDRNTQAILALRGKILNVEKASPSRALSSEEITNMITAIGTGVGDQFNIEKLRYNKIVMMSVDGEETTFVEAPDGIVSFVKIGEFIDKLIEKNITPSIYKVLCFNLKTRETQFKPIKTVIKHPIEEKLYEIKTSYGRNVKVTSSHSVFVFENGEIKLKKGNEIKKGDKIVAPRNLPLHNFQEVRKLNILKMLVKNKDKIGENIYIKGRNVEKLLKAKIKKYYEKNNEFVGKRIIIPNEFGKLLNKKRKEKALTQNFLCRNLKVKQPCVYYDWERGKSKPTLKNFKKYIQILNFNEKEAMSQVQITESKLENVWKNQYKNSGRNKVKDYIKLSEVNEEDLEFLKNVKICPAHYNVKGINQHVDVNSNFAKLLGFWIAEGSCSLRNGIRLSIGNNNMEFVNEFTDSFSDVFGISPILYKNDSRCAELKLVNRSASLFWKNLFGFSDYFSNTKKIPNIIFNISKKLQLEFLRGYFLGDGTIGKNGISFTTTSKDLANQIMYLLQSHGVLAGVSERQPNVNSKIVSKCPYFVISISNKKDLLILKRVWEDHRNSHYLEKKLNSKFPSINKKFEVISDDLIALDAQKINEVKSTNGQVYDFSVDEDENFIAGFGGLCCHNTDADVDGDHIKTLLLTFFFRFMPKLIEEGHVYAAMPPLYRIRKRKDQYVYSDEELKRAVGDVDSSNITRFKGLGEMSSDQLWETTMNPKSRKIKKIYIEDALEADQVFSMLMGDDVQSRKEFIQENAKKADLDV